MFHLDIILSAFVSSHTWFIGLCKVSFEVFNRITKMCMQLAFMYSACAIKA